MVTCVSCDVKNKEQNTVILHLVYDNYPKGYKTYMGEMSYSRDIIMVFYVKNDTNEPLSLPLCNDINCDTSLIMKVMRNGKAILLPCTYYSKYDKRIEKGDSVAIAIHLRSSNLSSIGVNLDKKSIDEYIQEMHFKFYKKENGILKTINSPFICQIVPNIQYKYGKLYLDYSKGNIAKEIEIYEDRNDSIIIQQIKETNSKHGGTVPVSITGTGRDHGVGSNDHFSR